MIVTLTDDEQMFVRHLASLRVAELVSESSGPVPDVLKEGSVHGARLAFCKALNIFPDLSVRGDRVLIGKTGKKIRMMYYPEVLPVYPIDGKHDIYVVMSGRIPSFELGGYVLKEGVGDVTGWQLKNMYKFTEDMVCMEFLK
jgi:hypothetical protein